MCASVDIFSALLTISTHCHGKGGVAILGLSLASANPHFSLLLEGEIALTLTGNILLFLRSVLGCVFFPWLMTEYSLKSFA
jgi:hypothetical protein